MDINDWLGSPNCALDEQVAKQIFEVLPEGGPIMVVMDNEGHYWISDTEEFSKLDIEDSFLKELCAKIDDGAEPIMTQVNECSIVAVQLDTGQTKCGYVVIALPKYSPESTLANIDLIETLLNQIGLIARLIEDNNLLSELQMKQLSAYTQNEASSN